MLTTQRLLLRPATSTADFQQLLPLYNNPQNMQFILDGKSNWTLDEIIEKWQGLNHQIDQGIGLQLVIHQSSNKVIGEAGILALPRNSQGTKEVGYMIDSSFRNRGFGYEVLQGLLHFASNKLALDTIQAGVRKENLSSIHLLKKSGFHKLDSKAPNNGNPLVYFEKHLITK
jgi:ribosomal-protein-alanine N-acetyltransferase